MSPEQADPFQLLEGGQTAYQNQDFSTAQRLLAAAAAQFSATDNPRGQAAALTNLGAAYAGSRFYENAIESLETAIRLHQSTHEIEGMAMATLSLAMVLMECGQLFRSRVSHERAVDLLHMAHHDTLATQSEQYARQLTAILPLGLSAEEQARHDRLFAQMKTADDSANDSYRTGNVATAIQYWELALRASRALTNDTMSARLMSNLGMARNKQGQTLEGIRLLQDAAALAAQAKAPELEGTALNNLGCVYLDSGDTPAAIDCLQKALSFRDAQSEPSSKAETLGNLAVAFARKGDFTSSIDALVRALEFFRELGNQNAVKIIGGYLARVRLGDKLEDVTFFKSDRVGHVRSNDDTVADLRTAQQHERAGDYAAAAALYYQLVNSAREHSDHRLEAFLLIALGFAERRCGRYSEGLLSYQQALSAAREAGDRELEARALNNLGVLYSNSDQATALKFLLAAASLRGQLPDKHELGETYVSLAGISSGDRAKAYLQLALPLLDSQRSPSAWAAAYEGLKTLLDGEELAVLRATHGETARSFAIEDLPSASSSTLETLHKLVPIDQSGAVGLIMRTPEERHRGPDFDWQLRFSKAGVLWTMHHRAEAVAELLSAIDEIERNRAKITFDSQRSEYFAEQWSVYDELISYLIEDGHLEGALEVVERSKTRFILDVLADAEYLPSTIPAEVKSTYLRLPPSLTQTVKTLSAVG